jgi:hypothetical protein
VKRQFCRIGAILLTEPSLSCPVDSLDNDFNDSSAWVSELS